MEISPTGSIRSKMTGSGNPFCNIKHNVQNLANKNNTLFRYLHVDGKTEVSKGKD